MADEIESELPPEPTDSMKDASPSDAGTVSTPQTEGPMLDVHAPHESIHTWKSFFIHIATIVVGLLIAVALEQSVELFHHRAQRHHLLEDLRHEAEDRIRIIPLNNRAHWAVENWFRDILHAVIAASVADGSVTFQVPAHPADERDQKPETAVWDAAKASGSVSVLSRSEIEVWERVDYIAKRGDKYAEAINTASRALRATEDQIGISFKAGSSVRVTLEQRNELTRDLGNLVEAIHDLLEQDTVLAGASDAVLHDARTPEQMGPFIEAALQTMPR